MKLVGLKSLVGMLVMGAAANLSHAHEAPGRGGHKDAPATVEATVESYFGRDGYYHLGLGAQLALGERQTLGIITHLVREDSSSTPVSSLGMEYGIRLEKDVELEAFSFGYFPAHDQHAWAVGLRATKEFEAGHDVKIAPFFGPTFASVRAVNDVTSLPVNVGHTMLFGGVLIERHPVEVMLFASHSLFTRNVRNLESHVDLEEMTHFAVYENNDGLARNSAGTEVSWEATEHLSLSARYAAIFFPGLSTRHSIMVMPTWKITERWEAFAGVQFLRGGPGNNDIGFGGISFRF